MGPVRSLDRSLAIIRNAGAPTLVSAWLGGSLVAFALMGSYYLEWVEGVHGLRPLLALGLIFAWWGRASLLAYAARMAVIAAYGDRARVERARSSDAIRLGSAVMLGLYPWLWLPLSGIWMSWWALLLVPLLAFRGGVAPSWMARAGCSASHGISGFREAFADSEGRRGTGVIAELLILGGMFPFAINLFVLFAFLISIGRSLLGLDVVLVEMFLSPSNPFVLLSVACTTAVFFEPLRVGWSVVSFVEARTRRDGFDVRERVRLAVEVEPSHERARRGLALALAFAALAAASPAGAQGLPGEGGAPFEEVGPYEYKPSEGDLGVHAKLDEILSRAEFREFDHQRDHTLRSLVERFFTWLASLLEPEGMDVDLSRSLSSWRSPTLPMPPAEFFAFLGALMLLGVALHLFRTRRLAAREDNAGPLLGAESEVLDPRDRSPETFMDDAAALAGRGQHRDALRALYFATLVALDRAHRIGFDPSRTNWHYLRQMPRGEHRRLFARFTRLFDHKWYGFEPTTRDDYEAGRELTRRICVEAADDEGPA